VQRARRWLAFLFRLGLYIHAAAVTRSEHDNGAEAAKIGLAHCRTRAVLTPLNAAACRYRVDDGWPMFCGPTPGGVAGVVGIRLA
jgi:hypothetical protein